MVVGRLVRDGILGRFWLGLLIFGKTTMLDLVWRFG